MRDIVFSSAPDGHEDIYTMSVDGKNLKRLTTSPGNGISNRTPEWSNDGKYIAYQSNQGGPRDLYIFDVESLETSRLTHSKDGACNHPSWSPDGSTILFTADRGQGMQLYTIGVDGSNEKPIKIRDVESKNIFNPCWVPNEAKIAFVLQSPDSEPESLYKASLDGTGLERISPPELAMFEFDFSPDGKKIVFDVKVDSKPALGDWDIFEMNSDGSEVKRLTNLEAMSSRPKWLSDGATIVFHTNRYSDEISQPQFSDSMDKWDHFWNQFEVCTMDGNGQNVVRLTNNQLRDLHPDG